MSLKLLEELCQAPGIPGREERIRAIVMREMRPLVDEIEVDVMGNVIGIIRGSGDKSVMVAGHMDEIGFRVKHIDEKGFVRLQPYGGFDPRNLIAQRVVVCGKEDLKGIIMPGIKPKHLQTSAESNVPDVSEFFVDLGRSKEEVEELVQIGDMVVMDRHFDRIGNNFTSKALDDRAGVYIMLEALRRVKNPEYTIYAVATVQEEVGLRGIVPAAFKYKPDVAVALDVTIAADIPGTADYLTVSKLGAGTAIKISDSASISNHKLVEFMRQLAEDNDVKYQMEMLPRGGTDAGGIERVREACPVITISLPTRYVHSVVEMANLEDLENSIKLLTLFLENGHRGDYRLD